MVSNNCVSSSLQEMGVEKAAMDISLFMKLQKRVRELEQERKRLQANVDKMEELAKRKVTTFNPKTALKLKLCYFIITATQTEVSVVLRRNTASMLL